MKRLLRGGRVVDPANGRDGAFDVLIDGDRIAKIGRGLPADPGVAVTDIGPAFVVCMPNTKPVNDNAGVTEYILKKAADARLARVYPIGAVTIGQAGQQLAEIGELRAAGCVAITDDGHPVATALLMRRALEYTRM